MPKSRRLRPIILSATAKKNKQHKETLVADIQEHFTMYKTVYAFRVHNFRNKLMKDIREKYVDSRFFMGKNKVMQLACGSDASNEAIPKASILAQYVKGNCGLLFTNEDCDEIEEFFRSHSVKEFARTGAKATEKHELKAGVLPMFAHNQDQFLRDLGLPVMLKDGEIDLEKDFTICTPGDVLTASQAHILKLLGIKMAVFSVELLCRLAIDEQTTVFTEFSTAADE